MIYFIVSVHTDYYGKTLRLTDVMHTDRGIVRTVVEEVK